MSAGDVLLPSVDTRRERQLRAVKRLGHISPLGTPSVSRLGYVPALDGLRGIAIALVIADHYFGYPPGGLVGVDLFFVLSGFLITSLLLERHGTIRDFYVRRARRLLPALAVMLAAYLVGCAVEGHDALKTVALGGLYFGNVVQAFNIAPIRQSALLHLWSLAEEEQFYLVWPWLILIVLRSRRLIPWLTGLLAVMLAYKIGLTLITHPSWERLMYGPDTHADGLVFGALLAAVRSKHGLNVPESFGKIGMSALVFGSILGRLTVSWAAYGLPVFEVGLVCLIAAAVSDTELAKGLSKRPLVGIGKISYSLYLWHAPVWFALSYYLTWQRDMLGLLALPVSLCAAVLSYRYIEQPFRRRRGRVDRAGSRSAALVS